VDRGAKAVRWPGTTRALEHSEQQRCGLHRSRVRRLGRLGNDGTRTISEGGEAQATESVGYELNTPEADGFAEGENIAW
jgi:hypothetical protein